MRNAFIDWLEQRTGLPTLCQTLFRWTVPGYHYACRFVPTMIVFAFILQAITGILLWAHYSPSAQSAWESLFYIQYSLPGGWMIRGIHHYSAQLLTALLGFYLLGFVLTGAYRAPREFVFWSIFVLLLFTLASSLTGDLLTWTLSGYSATLVRVRFLQMIPFVGESLFRIVAGGPEFGTLTIPRFLVLHILVFGGGFFAVMILWRFFEYRAAAWNCRETGDAETEKKPCQKVSWLPFWSDEFLKCSLACLAFMAVVLLLVYQKPILDQARPGLVHMNQQLPPEANRGAHLGAPADPSSFYDAARPEWSFRALYHFCNLKRSTTVVERRFDEHGVEKDFTVSREVDVFPGEWKFLAIFVIPPCVFLYLFLIPVIGHSKPGHILNVAAVLVLFAAFCYLTYASYHHDYVDASMADFRSDKAKADLLGERTIELCLAPEGIPPTGALTLLERDPLTQGPILYERHCATCHPFQPLEGEGVHEDFKPIPCETPKAPNLYNPIRKKWIAGFLDAKRIRSDDYFGKTKFARGSMVGFVRDEIKEIMEMEKDNMRDDDEILAEEKKSLDEDQLEKLLDERVDKMLDDLVDVLFEEARLDGPRAATPNGIDGLSEDRLQLVEIFDCGRCHRTYDPSRKPAMQAPDLRGYMSRDWMIGIIADPASMRFYGPNVDKTRGNDDMTSFHLPPDDITMTMEEIETLVDWLRGKWYRFEKITPTSLEKAEKTVSEKKK